MLAYIQLFLWYGKGQTGFNPWGPEAQTLTNLYTTYALPTLITIKFIKKKNLSCDSYIKMRNFFKNYWYNFK